MTDRPDDPERIAREAADWVVRLNGRAIDTETIETFARWRRDPQNAQAYHQVESAWSRAATIGADRDIAEATRAVLARGGKRGITDTVRIHALAGALVASLAVAAVLIFLGRPTTYVTAVGEQKLIRLADGSRVHINSDSSLSARVDTKRRELELERGEAYFEVAHDPSLPFIVETNRGRIVATGTRFDVDRRDNETRVTLTDGRVRIYDGPDAEARPAVFLRPGEAINLGQTPHDRPRPVDTEVSMSWLSGHLVFHQTPLAVAVAEMNRYTNRKIRLDVSGLRDAEVDGRFEIGDVDGFLGAVTALFPLRAVKDTDGGITLTSPT
ncbi:FecR domain-containing protein (plasmid) [Polymorphobacter sp. PAMC 29334]|uniref:FecR family protein n=1 Tax=Polymorphobacter sp. PAMC 29334 TaxID=2862331 RepID=UPI001C7615C8|nr:FecR domain-containing protein [Polymorphobacter sp. PAMC 29334]QYE37179.1 FecR domain-containing protein [Polymorphobacter sp. PAMC 29334]